MVEFRESSEALFLALPLIYQHDQEMAETVLAELRRRAAGNPLNELTELWVRPAISDPAVAEDLRQFTLSMRTEVTTTVAARLYDFDKPTLIAWSGDDVFFEQEDGARLAATIPNARLEVIEGARTFSMIVTRHDKVEQMNPERLSRCRCHDTVENRWHFSVALDQPH